MKNKEKQIDENKLAKPETFWLKLIRLDENIKERLATRDLLSELRDNGLITGGPKAFSLKDRQAFANNLDAILARFGKSQHNSCK